MSVMVKIETICINRKKYSLVIIKEWASLPILHSLLKRLGNDAQICGVYFSAQNSSLFHKKIFSSWTVSLIEKNFFFYIPSKVMRILTQ
jgi:hypothetical protein